MKEREGGEEREEALRCTQAQQIETHRDLCRMALPDLLSLFQYAGCCLRLTPQNSLVSV